MNTKILTTGITLGTVIAWTLVAALVGKAAVWPLAGLLPMNLWSSISYSSWHLLLIPAAVYLSVPILAWRKDSKRIAYCIPLAPLLGLALFFGQDQFARLVVKAALGWI